MATTESNNSKTTKPKRLLKLNTKQQELLILIYKFRFVTSALLADYKGLSNYSVMNKALNILVDRGYLVKHYDSSYKLKGKAARYYLTTQGIRHIRNSFDEVEEKVLRGYYKNKTLTDEFVDHTVDVFRVYNELRRTYPGKLHYATRQKLVGHYYLPQPLPDLYFGTLQKDEQKRVSYFLDLSSDNLLFLHKKRFKALMEHKEEGDWQSEMETSYPMLLFILNDARSEKRFNRHVTKTLDDSYMDEDDIEVYTTSMQALKASTADNKAIWTGVFEDKKPRALKLVNS